MNIEALQHLAQQIESEISQVQGLGQLENIKAKFLAKQGLLAEWFEKLKQISIEEKRQLGPLLNQVKTQAEQLVNAKREALLLAQVQAANANMTSFDVTAEIPGVRVPGNLHFYTKFKEEIEDIFASLGFETFSGPEVETDFFNFTALNIGQNHPARDMYDTLWLDMPNHLLRTHTSPVQIRTMLSRGAPLAGIAPGRVFRHEAVDATHEVVFNQCEGIFINKNVHLGHLFGIAKTFLQRLFNKQNLDIRVRPGFFPFVEPGVEIDMRCIFCTQGCGICKKTTWIEVFPGGMIHPKVLEYGKIDSKIYSGFAFGFGIDRLAMLRHKITDLRHFHAGDLRFLSQF